MDYHSIVAITLGASAVATAGGLYFWAKNAAAGYEDADGFHYGEAPTTACAVPPPGWDCTRTPGHDGPCAAVPAAAVDWSKPLELTDGTPLVLSPPEVWEGGNLDVDGHYWVRRADGKRFKEGGYFYAGIDVCVDPQLLQNFDHIRNRAEAPTAANSNVPQLTDDQRVVLLELGDEIGIPAATLVRNTGLPHKRVVEARKQLAAKGLAELVALNGDWGESNQLAGRGYVLTVEGRRARAALAVALAA